jgi:hypothetical protein
MRHSDNKPVTADDPTAEEEAIQIDGTSTDNLDSGHRVRVVAASEAATGTVEFDQRGQPRWKYNENPPNRDPETTFNLLKALENAAIVLEERTAPAREQEAEPSFNPYDRGTLKPRRKP